MSLDNQIQNKALTLASQQADTLSVQIAADLLQYQSDLVAQFSARGITLVTPMSFTQASVIAAWLLPQLQNIFLSGLTSSAQSNLNTAGLIQPSP